MACASNLDDRTVERLFRRTYRIKRWTGFASQALVGTALILPLSWLLRVVWRWLRPGSEMGSGCLVGLGLALLLLLILAGGRQARLARGFANRAVGEKLFLRGDRRAAVFFQRAIDEFSQLTTNPSVPRIIRKLHGSLALALSLTDRPAEEAYPAAVLSGTAEAAAAVIWRRVQTAGGGELEPLLADWMSDFLDRFPAPAASRELSTTFARIGELALSRRRPDLGLPFLETALATVVRRDENVVLVRALLAAGGLAGGDVVAAARHLATARSLQEELADVIEFSFADVVEVGDDERVGGAPPTRNAKAWRQIERRVGRPFPCPPAAVLYLAFSAVYRSLGVPSLAWPCCLHALRVLREVEDAFAGLQGALDALLCEVALIAAQESRLPVAVLPDEALAGGLVAGRWPCDPPPPLVLDLAPLGLFVLGRYEQEPPAVELLQKVLGRHRRAPEAGDESTSPAAAGLAALALDALGDREGSGERPGPAVELPRPSDVESPWELSRWGLAAEWLGDRRAATAFQRQAAAKCAERPEPDHTWIVLRAVRLLSAEEGAAAALGPCREWLEQALDRGWPREACACIGVLDGRLASAEGAREVVDDAILRAGAACRDGYRVERLHLARLAGRQAYEDEEWGEAGARLATYLEDVDLLRRDVEAAGLPAHVDPRRVAEAFSMAVDSFSRLQDHQRALGWSERSKRWHLHGAGWRPSVAPVAAPRSYPFTGDDR